MFDTFHCLLSLPNPVLRTPSHDIIVTPVVKHGSKVKLAVTSCKAAAQGALPNTAQPGALDVQECVTPPPEPFRRLPAPVTPAPPHLDHSLAPTPIPGPLLTRFHTSLHVLDQPSTHFGPLSGMFFPSNLLGCLPLPAPWERVAVRPNVRNGPEDRSLRQSGGRVRGCFSGEYKGARKRQD